MKSAESIGKFATTPTPANSPPKIGCMIPTPSPKKNVTSTPKSTVRQGRFHHDEMTSDTVEAIAKQMDWDCDGVSNHDDNCIDVANPNQKDKNRNGIGDACEAKKRKKNNRIKQN